MCGLGIANCINVGGWRLLLCTLILGVKLMKSTFSYINNTYYKAFIVSVKKINRYTSRRSDIKANVIFD